MRKFIFWVSALILFSSVVFAQVREPAVSGTFYPNESVVLHNKIVSYLKNVPAKKAEGDLIALIVPHAGYEYSGQVAAYAYKELIGRDYDTVIIMGPSHHIYFPGISVWDSGYFKTPLGGIEVDKDLARKLEKNSKKIVFIPDAHREEHSIEVQIPFLQRTLKNFKIVPIVFGSQSIDNCNILTDAIISSIGSKKVLIIASSDMSHYYSYEKALKMDKLALDAIKNGDISRLAELLSNHECELCGYGPVITAMLVASNLGANNIEVLNYANSGDVTGDREKVVGYSSIAFSFRETKLSKEDRLQLLSLARKSLENYFFGKGAPQVLVSSKALKESRGVFVTLIKHGQLRGCIGYIRGIKHLYQAVSEMSLAAATRDIRFEPVNASELKDIKIEISVLSRLRPFKRVEDIVIGKHGLYIVKGYRSGLLLPQVATEYKLSREEFLKEVCHKANLETMAWKDPDAQIFIFTADVFHEE